MLFKRFPLFHAANKYPEVNDQVSFQWLLILTISELKPEITEKTNHFISDS